MLSLFSLFLGEDKPLGPVDLKSAGHKALMISKVMQSAIKAFQEGHLKKFDALVKDEACQIRACKIADLYNEHALNLEATAESANDLYVQIKNKISDSASGTFSKYYAIPNGELDERIKFIFLSHLLFLTKKEVNIEGTIFKKDISCEVEKLKEVKEGLSDNQLVNFTKKAQKELAKLSVQHLLKIGELPKKTVNDRECVPCYYGTELLLKEMLQNNKKLLVEVIMGRSPAEQCSIEKQLYQPNLAKTGFEKAAIQDTEEAVVVFSGHSIYENHDNNSKVLDTFPSIYEVLMANAAHHTQYPGGKEDDSLPKDAVRETYKALAVTLGCTLKNKKLFTIDHVFASTLKEVI